MASSNTSIMYELAIFVPGRVRLLPGGLYTTDLPGLPLPLVGTLHWSPPGPVFHDLCARLHGLHGFKTRRNFNGGEFYSLCNSLVFTSLFCPSRSMQTPSIRGILRSPESISANFRSCSWPWTSKMHHCIACLAHSLFTTQNLLILNNSANCFDRNCAPPSRKSGRR